MNKQEIRENIYCPQFGDNKYGKWGALRLQQRKCIYDLLKEIESIDLVIKTLDKRINKAIKMLEESQKGLEEWHFDGYDPCLEDIIKILKGEDNENNN